MHWTKTSVAENYRCSLCDRGPPGLLHIYTPSTADLRRLHGSFGHGLPGRWGPDHPELDMLEALLKMDWQEYRIALLRKNLATWRRIEEGPEKGYIQKYMRWSGWSEGESRKYVRTVIRDLEDCLRKAVGGELQ